MIHASSFLSTFTATTYLLEGLEEGPMMPPVVFMFQCLAHISKVLWGIWLISVWFFRGFS